MHEHDVRYALRLPPRPEPGHIAAALDEVATGLGYIAGRRAALPDGSRVRIDLTGPVPTTYRIEVAGRATLVESFDEPATVGLELPATLYLRLTGGRDDHRPGPDGINYSGDLELGRRLVDNLAFTI